MNDDVLAGRGAEGVTGDIEVLVDDERLDGRHLEGAKGVFDAEAVLAGIVGDFVEILLNEPVRSQSATHCHRTQQRANALLLLDEFDVGQRFGSELDSLVEAVLAAVADVDDLDDLGRQSRVEHVALVEDGLEVSRAGEDETLNVDLVVGDKVLDGELGHLADVVVSLLFSETSESEGGLTTTAVLLGQVDGELARPQLCF